MCMMINPNYDHNNYDMQNIHTYTYLRKHSTDISLLWVQPVGSSFPIHWYISFSSPVHCKLLRCIGEPAFPIPYSPEIPTLLAPVCKSITIMIDQSSSIHMCYKFSGEHKQSPLNMLITQYLIVGIKKENYVKSTCYNGVQCSVQDIISYEQQTKHQVQQWSIYRTDV